jgi:thiaminase
VLNCLFSPKIGLCPPLPTALHLQTTVAEVLAAMMPCSRLYGYLGCALAAATQQVGLSRHAYSEWVDTYSGADYLVSVLTAIFTT